jgi:Transposase DDE domain
MRAVINSEHGGALYKFRQKLIEPVFGHTKHNRQIERFHRRGRAACRTEWRLNQRRGESVRRPVRTRRGFNLAALRNLVSRAAVYAAENGRGPAASQITFTLGARLRAATGDPARLSRQVRAALDDHVDTRRGQALGEVTVRRNGEALEICSTKAPEDVERVARALLAGEVLPYTPRRRIDRFIPSPIMVLEHRGLGAPCPITCDGIHPVGCGLARGLCSRLRRDRGSESLLRTSRRSRDWPSGRRPCDPTAHRRVRHRVWVAMLGRNPAVSTHAGRHLVDPLMLSFAIATTAGFLDFGLKPLLVRIVAYSEMLFVVSVAGGSAYTLARGTWAPGSESYSHRAGRRPLGRGSSASASRSTPEGRLSGTIAHYWFSALRTRSDRSTSNAAASWHSLSKLGLYCPRSIPER